LKTAIPVIKYFVVYLFLCAATFLMLEAVVQYFTFRDDIGFLLFKKDYLHNNVWKTAFYIHVFSAIITLLAGFTQFSDHLLKQHKQLHRIIGKVYAGAILFINFPAAMVMAFYANGHTPSKIAFIILDCLWFWFTLKAVSEAKKKNIAAHKQFMIRSYALTLSAVTLRIWKLVLSHTLVIDPLTLYMIDAWLGFVPNLLFAELLIRLPLKRNVIKKQ
jgi:uncharacterized membrane protein